jgi:DNA-binding NtrC family response regulator
MALAEPNQEIDRRSLSKVDAGTRDAPQHVAPEAEATRPLREQVAEFERTVLTRVLAVTGQNQSEAARRLGVSRMTLIEKMKRAGLRG